jgi:hypothetical protein
MTEESLAELATAFENWRKNRRNLREPVPQALWEQTIRAIDVHGDHAVAQATKLQRSRIVERAKKSKNRGTEVPAYSRVSIAAPSEPGCPIAEVETAAGVKLRVFVQTRETVELLTSLCSDRGAS